MGIFTSGLAGRAMRIGIAMAFLEVWSRGI